MEKALVTVTDEKHINNPYIYYQDNFSFIARRLEEDVYVCLYFGDSWYTDDEIYEDTLKNKGVGGTETWAIELMTRLSMDGNCVMFCKVNNIRVGDSGLIYVPYQLFDLYIGKIKINNLLLNCAIGSHRMSSISAKHIYYTPSCESINLAKTKSALCLERIDGIFYLSEYQKQCLMNTYDIDDESLFIKTFCGVNHNNYEDCDTYQKENSMVWSSSYNRGLAVFIKYCMPIIKKSIPDFKLYVCSYCENYGMDTSWLDSDGVEFIGSLDKEKLSSFQKKCKLWAYPNYGLTNNLYFFKETFCITAVENAMANNAIVCLSGKGGLDSTLNGYSGFIDGSFFNENETFYETDLEDIGKKIGFRCVEILQNEGFRDSLANEARCICSEYTWDNCYKVFSVVFAH